MASSIERIGEFMVRIGLLTQQQKDHVLEEQRKNPDKLFGQIAVELGYIDDGAIDTYLESRRLN
ncbi:MAG: hypothetical protein K9L68_07795 [Spirochaetales bacterium]|nr:hypothetical protein [Spirochaetales bacterium]MCF7938485.1 hypothetical protein [Spirochaetales bacterium]